MARLVLEGLGKRFGPVVAVDDLSLEIADGEFFALLGPSGCGKTTTMRMVAGLEAPTSGRVLLDGRDVTGFPPADRDLAMVFQDYALYPHMTVLENVGYPLKVRGVKRGDIGARVREVAGDLGLEDLLGRRPGELSGGQQQRSAVARAVVRRSSVCLMDEPLSNLDAKLRFEARAFLKRLQRELKLTIVYVTHDQLEAMALADRMAVMRDGRVQQVGAPLEIYRRPANAFVAGFIGSPPMNLVPGTLELQNGRACFRHGPAGLDLGVGLAGRVANGEAVTLGVRPEHLRLATPRPGDLAAEVVAVETLGAESLAMVRLGGVTLAARLPGDEPPALPPQVRLAPEPNRLHLFRADGERVGP